VKWQAMRGSALCAPAGPVPRGLAGLSAPCTRTKRRPCPSLDHPRQRRPAPTLRPKGTPLWHPHSRSLAPRDPARTGDAIPFPPYPGAAWRTHEPRSETRVRSKHLTIRLSPYERATIDQAADRSGLHSGQLCPSGVARGTRAAPGAPATDRAARIGAAPWRAWPCRRQSQPARPRHDFGRGVDAWELKQELHGLGLVRDAILKALGRDA